MSASKPVILINPGSFLSKSWSYRALMFPIPPMSLAYLAGSLEQNNCNSMIFDQFATGISNVELARKIRNLDPLMIGISCLTPSMGSVRELIGFLRSNGSKAPIVLGNTHAHVFAKELLSEGLCDAVAFGEGERSIVAMASAYASGKSLENIPDIGYIEGGHVVLNQRGDLVDDLESLAYPAWNKLDIQSYRTYPFLMLFEPLLPIQASRGCAYSCTFCSQDKAYKKPRFRAPEALIREMITMQDQYGVEVMGFTDSYFPYSHRSGLEFCERWKDSRLKNRMRWFTETRVDKINEELLHEMKQADCEMVMYGFESGDQAVLDSMSKGTTIKQARDVMRATKKVGLRSIGFFILDFPGETRQSIERTISFALELNPDMAKFNLFVPLPGSQVFEKNDGGHDTTSDPERFTSWSVFVGASRRPPYAPDGMTGRQVVRLQRKAMFRFFLRPSKIVHLLKGGMMWLRYLVVGGLAFSRSLIPNSPPPSVENADWSKAPYKKTSDGSKEA